MLAIHWNSVGPFTAFLHHDEATKPNSQCRLFMEIFIIAAWNIWKQRTSSSLKINAQAFLHGNIIL
uniref:Uncharacterized protein n=1 Tax=Arundo donax TaxID=35708 RepID=A0A0A8Y388_ARUDO